MVNVFSSLLFSVPMLAILIVGIALVASRRERLGVRTARFALGGLGVLLVTEIAQMAWSAIFPLLMEAFNLRVQQISVIAPAVSLILTCATALAVSLLIAAIVTRSVTPGPQPAHPSETVA